MHKLRCTHPISPITTRQTNQPHRVRNLPTTPTNRAVNTTQTKAGNGRNDCAEFTHAPTSRAALHHRPKHNNTNKSRQRLQRLCGIYPRTHKVARCTTSPNTTQTKAGNGRNDCAEFTHAPTSRAAPSPQTQQHKQRPATAATIVRNLPTHPQSRCTVGPKHNTNKKQPGNGRIDYAEFSHGGHQIPASKNVLKTSFSKGELGKPAFRWPLFRRCYTSTELS